ncbi:MAG: GIY-YIG nuclease family protein [Thermodesulfobacteriota bacterium]
MKERTSKDQGSYLLILELKKPRKIPVGKLGRVSFRSGFYIYVGSALAHLNKRIERHWRLKKRHHWHIDRLRAVADFHSAFVVRSSARLECKMGGALSKICESTIPGFGCSDCPCDTHLFGMREDPLHSAKFKKLLQSFRMDRYRFGVTIESPF